MKLILSKLLVSIIVVSVFMQTSPIEVARADGPIVLDGNFSDWDGQTHITDPSGDAQNSKTDIVGFYWANNADDETAYFMTERLDGGSTAVTYYLYIDTDDDGNFSEDADRLVIIDYDPSNNASNVRVQVYSGTGSFIRTVANNADYGESKNEGGSQVEWGVPFTDLGIEPYQTISMQLESRQGNHASDSTATVQWSPADILGVGLLLLILVVASGWMAYRRKKLA
jgi:hypothetical protein